MIYQVTMYAGKCDNCGKEIELGGGEYSAYNEKEHVREEMVNSDYYIDGDVHYCPDCWSYDDNDQVILKSVEKPVNLTPGQIADRKEAIAWYRNPDTQSGVPDGIHDKIISYQVGGLSLEGAIYKVGYDVGVVESSVWVKASDFNFEYRKTYLAKLADDEEIKSGGRFQESDGTFFWNEQGIVPIPKRQHHRLLLLNEPKVNNKSDEKLNQREWINAALQTAKETIDFANDNFECPKPLVETWGNLYMNVMHALDSAKDESGAAAGSCKEEAVAFAEWGHRCVKGYDPISDKWVYGVDETRLVMHELYDIFKSQNK